MRGRSTIAFHLFTLSYYIKEFGVVTGAARFAADRIRHRFLAAGTIFKVRTPRDGDIFVRARTNDLAVAVQTFILRGSDITQMKQYRALVRRHEDILRRGKVPIVIDGGGNIGTVSVFFSHLFPKARVVLVEPDQRNFEIARRNTERLGNVDLRRAALWSSPAAMRFSTDAAHLATDSISVTPVDDGADNASGTVAATTIDDIVAGVADGELLLLKLDIEGAEAEAIVPDSRWAKMPPVCIVEPHDWMIGGNASLHRLLAIPAFRDGDIVICGENLVFFPATSALDAADKTGHPAVGATAGA